MLWYMARRTIGRRARYGILSSILFPLITWITSWGLLLLQRELGIKPPNTYTLTGYKLLMHSRRLDVNPFAAKHKLNMHILTCWQLRTMYHALTWTFSHTTQISSTSHIKYDLVSSYFAYFITGLVIHDPIVSFTISHFGHPTHKFVHHHHHDQTHKFVFNSGRGWVQPPEAQTQHAPPLQ